MTRWDGSRSFAPGRTLSTNAVTGYIFFGFFFLYFYLYTSFKKQRWIWISMDTFGVFDSCRYSWKQTYPYLTPNRSTFHLFQELGEVDNGK